MRRRFLLWLESKDEQVIELVVKLSLVAFGICAIISMIGIFFTAQIIGTPFMQWWLGPHVIVTHVGINVPVYLRIPILLVTGLAITVLLIMLSLYNLMYSEKAKHLSDSLIHEK